MGLFGRRKAQADSDEQDAAVDVEEGAASSVPGQPHGPWDAAQVSEAGDREDFGALRIPRRPGMQIRLDVEGQPRRIVAATVALDGSTLQLQVFAAPKTLGLWDEIREEIASSVTKQGGTVDELQGPFGAELLARLPSRTNQGRTTHRPVRFVGVDGPRWFLRGVFTGPVVTQPDVAHELENVLAECVVDRGEDARPPRELLALTPPGQVETESTPSSDKDLLTRGPEITEVR